MIKTCGNCMNGNMEICQDCENFSKHIDIDQYCRMHKIGIRQESDMTPDYMEMAKAELVDVLFLLKNMQDKLESVMEDKDGRDI